MIRIHNPTGRGTECRVVEIDGIRLCFSYETLIGFTSPNDESSRGIAYRVPNRWGNTTAGHMMSCGLTAASVVTEDQLQNLAATEIMCLAATSSGEIEEAA